MRRLTWIVLVASLVLALAMAGGAAAEQGKGPKVEVNASYTVAANFLVAKRNADPNIIAGEVEPCHRKSRRRVVCPSYVIRSGTPKLRSDYQAIICATRKGKAFLKVTAETCVTAPPPWN